MAKSAKKIAVKSKVEMAKKPTYPKVTKKTVKSALRSEVEQNNAKAFAFPTAAEIEDKQTWSGDVTDQDLIKSAALASAVHVEPSKESDVGKLKKNLSKKLKIKPNPVQEIISAYVSNAKTGERTFVALSEKPKQPVGWIVSGLNPQGINVGMNVVICHERFVLDANSTKTYNVAELVLWTNRLKPEQLAAGFVKNDIVEHPAHGQGRVVKVKGNECYDVIFSIPGEGSVPEHSGQSVREVVGEELKFVGHVTKVAGGVKPASDKTKGVDLTRFENLPLLCGFLYDGVQHVKVGNTSAIHTAVIVHESFGDGKHPVIWLSEFGLAQPAIKVRLKKDSKVKPIASRALGA